MAKRQSPLDAALYIFPLRIFFLSISVLRKWIYLFYKTRELIFILFEKNEKKV